MEARNLIANMAANSQQFGDRHETPIRRVNEVGINFDSQQQLATLTSLVQTMAMRDNLPRPSGICPMIKHMTDMCPSLQELVKTLAMSQKNLQYQMGQMAKEISQIKAQGSGKLPSQTILNPKENVSVITLRNGKQLEEVSSKPNELSQLETKPPKSKSPPKVILRIQ